MTRSRHLVSEQRGVKLRAAIRVRRTAAVEVAASTLNLRLDKANHPAVTICFSAQRGTADARRPLLVRLRARAASQTVYTVRAVRVVASQLARDTIPLVVGWLRSSVTRRARVSETEVTRRAVHT